MRIVRRALVLALSTAVLPACDDPVRIAIGDLGGFWNATRLEYEDTSGRDPAPALDIIERGGMMALDVAPDGDFQGSVLIPAGILAGTGGPDPIEVGGTILLLDEDELGFDFDEATEASLCPTPEQCVLGDFEATFSIGDGTLVMVSEEATFDFAAVEDELGLEPAGPVAARLTLRLQR